MGFNPSMSKLFLSFKIFRLTLVDPDQGLEQRLVPDVGDENSWDTMSGIYAQVECNALRHNKCKH